MVLSGKLARRALGIGVSTMLTSSALVIAPALAWEKTDTPTLVMVTEENPPYNFTNPKTGQVEGMAADKVRLLMAEIGQPYTLKVLDWPTAFAEARDRSDTCVFLTSQSDERRPLFQWVMPLGDAGIVLFARADWSEHPQTLDDVRPFTILVQSDDATDRWFAKEAERIGHFNMLRQIGRDDLTPLLDGRAQLYAASLHNGSNLARRFGTPLKVVQRLYRASGGIACGLKVDKSIVDRLQAALQRIIQDGRARQIDATYLPGVDWTRGVGQD